MSNDMTYNNVKILDIAKGGIMRIWLKKIRKSQNLTQYEVAVACDISRTMITEVENGKAMPSPKTAKKIASVLHFDWTKFYEDQKVPKNIVKKDSPKDETEQNNKNAI